MFVLFSLLFQVLAAAMVVTTVVSGRKTLRKRESVCERERTGAWRTEGEKRKSEERLKTCKVRGEDGHRQEFRDKR